jgi:hypothetical protein
VALACWPAAAQEAPANDWTRHIRLGVQVGLNISADFGLAGQFAVSGTAPGPAGVGGANHVYDDGYVLVDSTGNALGRTSYWGYESATQFDAGAQTLTFHSARSFTQNSSASVDGNPMVGLDLAFGGRIGRALGGEIGWDLGFGLLPITIQDDRALATTLTRTVHSFATGGIVVPDAPYNGGSSGVGPTIPDVATALPDDVIAGTITGDRELELMLYALRLGPTLQWQLAPRWSVQVSAGGSLGIVSGDYNFDETILLTDGSTAFNSGSSGATEVTFGGYASAMVMWRTAERADIYLGAQFMTLGKTQFSSGGRTAELDLSSGIYLMTGLNWPF